MATQRPYYKMFNKPLTDTSAQSIDVFPVIKDCRVPSGYNANYTYLAELEASLSGATEFFPFINNVGDKQYLSDGSYFEATSDASTSNFKAVIINYYDKNGVAIPNVPNITKRLYEETGGLRHYYTNYYVISHDHSALSNITYQGGYFFGLGSFKNSEVYAVIKDKMMVSQWYDASTGIIRNDNGWMYIPVSISDLRPLPSLLLNSWIGEDKGATSTDGGQDGTYNSDSDIISDDVITDADGNITNMSNIISSGFAKMYRLSTSQLKQLADYLYSAPTEFIEHLQKLGINPLESIINLGAINKVVSGTDSPLIICGRDTLTRGAKLAYQYIELNCGSVTLNKYFGNALDYSPYTKVTLYLPFIGSVQINTDDIMGKTVNIKYNIDLLNGSCVAKLLVGGSIIYTFTGNCMSQIPLTSADAKSIYASTIGLIGSVVGAIASGGASLPLSGVVASGLSVMGSKENVSRGGSCVSASGNLNVKKPYFTITRPIQSLPKNFKHFKGYTSNITMNLSDVRGYTEISYIDLKGVDATKEEKERLKDILQSGFYIN